MSDQDVFDRLVPLIHEVTGVRPDEITMSSNLVMDLGAESIDLLDLSFLIEETFGITIEPDEFERRAVERIPGGVYERDGRLTDEALAELRRALPEVDPRLLSTNMRKVDLPSVLNVGVFVHLIERKRAEAEAGVADA